MKSQENKKATGLYELKDESGKLTNVEFNGRVRWALENLIEAGEVGCTPIDTPGPRWSHYVWMLRGEGVLIETITEPHGGSFPGTHARYVLRSRIRRIASEAPA